jgi:hypothetical protein
VQRPRRRGGHPSGPHRDSLRVSRTAKWGSFEAELLFRRLTRQHLLHTVDSLDALADLVVVDRVRINHYARPRHLEGLRATISDLDAVTATISLEQPIGRSTTSRLRCPPLALDHLIPVSS